jgi:hypothetical protein
MLYHLAREGRRLGRAMRLVLRLGVLACLAYMLYLWAW